MHLPSKILLGYLSCNPSTLEESLSAGLNVIVWSFIQLSPLQLTFDTKCLYDAQKIISRDVVQLISIGGWNAPHLGSERAQILYDQFKLFNQNLIKDGFRGFDGLDWDLEGNDNPSSPLNHFSLDTLDRMGEISRLAKRDGFIVTMAPAESYFDVTESVFDLDLDHSSTEYPDFKYKGRNCYAYLYEKYRETVTSTGVVDTFDLVMMQFYEKFSHMLYNTTVLKQDPSTYLKNMIERYVNGYTLNLPDLGERLVSIPREKFVVGLANGWATNTNNFLRISEDDIKNAWGKSKFRGFGVWSLMNENENGYNFCRAVRNAFKIDEELFFVAS